MLIYQATKRVSQYVLKDEKEFVEQLKAQYELQCEKDNTDDKKELLEMGAKHGNLSINSENIFPIIKKWMYSDHDIFCA